MAGVPINYTFEYKIVEADDSFDDCPICLNALTPGHHCKRSSRCSHIFHTGCLDKWLKTNNTCPICRYVIDEPNEQHDSDSFHDDLLGAFANFSEARVRINEIENAYN